MKQLLISPDEHLAGIFQDLSRKLTGKAPKTGGRDDGKSDLILIGSDAVNHAVHLRILEGKLDSLGIATGTDDFRILSQRENGRHVLYLAGGRRRADAYAVYDYFERFCGCRWFWDGDILPKRKELPLEGLDYTHHFRFRYRGLRYFAHRSLHRFQAEHWSREDWQKEIEYLLKRKFNIFMLRIGQDDLFQRTFPDTVPYPPENGPLPEAISRSYDNRTQLWSLEERSRLRTQILQLAKARDLMHPVDMGPMTHWYSRTPIAFLQKEKPTLLTQSTADYAEQTGMVWDFSDDRNLENYWKLTKAEIQFYDRPDFFHIIGLAERRFGGDRENFQLKLYAYRRFIRKLREEFPSAPLFMATWDMMLNWTPKEVQMLLQELDPENTLLLDYTEDLQYRHNDFKKWGLPHHFPYVFGIFQGVERYSGSAFDFRYTERNFRIAEKDPFCKGMILWSEMSHAHTMLHEYLAKRSANLPFSLQEFCQDRYGKFAEAMKTVWNRLEGEFAENSFHRTLLVFNDTFNLLNHLAEMQKDHNEQAMRTEFRKIARRRPAQPGVYSALADIAARTKNPMVIRDVVDIARTHLMSDILKEFAMIMTRLWNWRKGNGKRPDATRLVQLNTLMRDLLATQPEYSLAHSLKLLKENHPLHPAAEQTLKDNAENSYCRTYITELASAIYIPEAEFLDKWIRMAQRTDRMNPQLLNDAAEKIRGCFHNTPLEHWMPRKIKSLPKILETLETT